MAVKTVVKGLLGRGTCHERLVGIDALERDWTFRPSRADAITRFRRAVRLKPCPAPPVVTIRPVTPQRRWIVYFLYLPDGRLDPAHRFTLERLRAADAALALICATPDTAVIPDELHAVADALYWKGLRGFDFSAYALGLREIARRSPGADVLVLNDSTFGPFVPIDSLWGAMRWDLTGFTASAQVQNHIQSYAFHLRDWTPARLAALDTIFPGHSAYDHYRDAVDGQETRFATVAARSMSVGALWYADQVRCNDPTIFAALPLVAAGFPFLKRALLSKHAHFVDTAAVADMLRRHGHPLPSPAGN